MALYENFTHLAGHLFFNTPAKQRSMKALTRSLEKDGKAVRKRFAKAAPTKRNHTLMTHVIGIERWAQNRLCAALESRQVPIDEYNDYRPARNTDFANLVTYFQETRQETIRLARLLADQEKEGVIIKHNFYGRLSVRGWLQYLNTHANLESLKMRS